MIAGGASTPADLAHRCAAIVRALLPGRDYMADEFARNVHLADSGAAKVEEALYCNRAALSSGH